MLERVSHLVRPRAVFVFRSVLVGLLSLEINETGRATTPPRP